MDKTMAGLLGAVGALVAGAQAQAATPATAPQAVLEAASYTELLRPIPNALETLKALDAPEAQNVQYYPYYYRPPPPAYYYDHHHHHHHRNYRREYRGHHHHHHNGYYR